MACGHAVTFRDTLFNQLGSQSQARITKFMPPRTGPSLPSLSSKSFMNQTCFTPLTAREEEDAYIAYLERKLGYGKAVKRTTSRGKDEDDGLDDLLRDLNSFENTMPSHVQSAVDDSEAIENDEDEEDDIMSEQDFNMLSNAEGGDGDNQWTGFTNAENIGIGPEAEPLPTKNASAKPDEPVTGSRDGARLRGPIKVDQAIKGLLNRMSEQNIASIVDGVEEVYRNNRRHDVTSTLTTLIIDGISSHSMLLDSYVVLHAAFVSGLHKLIGIEFAAYFVQRVVASYENHFTAFQESGQEQAVQHSSDNPDSQAPTEGEAIGKECSNLLVLLSELYNFQMISCVLVYDIIRGLLDGGLSEFKVELLLKIVRTDNAVDSGPQLRQDDPSALKSIIQIVHSKLPSQANALSSRTRFMVETLGNLKNNKVKRNAGQTAGEKPTWQIYSLLSGHGLTVSTARTHEPLRVSLADLHSAESKGKWWLTEADALSENVLLKLAKKQGMNTDIRRGIFVVLMSSDDYVDACERLSQLKLTEEKAFNPYYALVGQQLCRTSHSHRITLQFCLWDFLRDLGETNVGGAEVLKNLNEDEAGFSLKNISNTRLRNVARAYAWWIAKDCCTLAILKPIDFTVLKPQTRAFLNELFTHVFASSQLPTPLLSLDPKDLPKTRNKGPLEEVFIKATRMQTLTLGLTYFIGETFKKDEGDAGFLKWASRVAQDTLRTGMDVVSGL
ncbi:Suppressor of glycerol defect protein 1 [Grifola frondosa]|uniref:Suppressor of glycerol defect protein 1 n=1 Tax=Grifola frondosa TaxID=5627 RepID=A0A1C7M6L9_GRIFR|nr:Suppressor of glycerol defect protein 1 [Grifola frondosa]